MLDTFVVQDLYRDINEAIFQEEINRVSSELWRLLRDNHDMGSSANSFLMAGRRYTFNKEGTKEKSLPIHPSLGNRARTVVREWEIIQAHKNKFDGFMGMLQEHCRNMQDVRDLLPNVVVDALDEHHHLKLYSRMREPYVILKNDPTLRSKYDSMKKVFFQYLARKLIE